MDNHPIPQDVTGFQFKLIGNMTIKQFAYVMAGVVLAVILYYLPLQSAFGVLVKIVFIPLFGASGLLLAFLPVEGRSIDVMLGNFLKALFAPNQYIYHKTGRLFDFTNLPAAKPVAQQHKQATIHTTATINKAKELSKLLQTSHVQKLNKLDEKESAFLQAFSAPTPLPSPALQTHQQPIVPSQPVLTLTPQPTPPSHQPVDQPVDETISSNPKEELSAPMQPKQIADSLAQQEHQLSQQLQQAKQDEQSQQVAGVASAAHQKVTLLERQVQALHFQRQQLEQQLAHLQNQLAQQQATSKAPPPTKQPASPAATQGGPVQSQTQQDLTKRGLPHIPDTPNVIVGVVKDPRGNVLPNILVEVKDKDGNPVRAFKTNNLGQFASATPLAPGNYTVELEDPKQQNRFDVIQLAATNQILLPIEIVSHDAREELRKQLFN